MPKKKVVVSEVVTEEQKPVVDIGTAGEPADVIAEDLDSAKAPVVELVAAVKEKAPAKKKVVKRKATKKPAKKMVVKAVAAPEVAEEHADSEEASTEGAAEEVRQPSDALPELGADESVVMNEASGAEENEVTTTEAAPEPAPVRKPLLTRRHPLPATLVSTRSEVATSTKTSLAVGLAAAGALALAAAAGVLMLKNNMLGAPGSIQLREDIVVTDMQVPASFTVAMTSQGTEELDPLVADGVTQYALAMFQVAANGDSWMLQAFRAKVLGVEVMKDLVVLNQDSEPVVATWTLVEGTTDTFDVQLQEEIAEGSSKTYTVMSAFSGVGAAKQAQVTVLAEGLEMVSGRGNVEIELPADLMGPLWNLILPE